MEVEITALISKTRARIYEVPISYYGRTYEEGKKIGMIDGVHAIYYILHYNLFSRWNAASRAYVAKVNAWLDELRRNEREQRKASDTPWMPIHEPAMRS